MEKELIENGYHKCDHVGFEKYADCYYRKKFTYDTCGSCQYFINIYKYSAAYLNSAQYTAKVQFYRGEDTFNVEIFHNPENTVEDIERIVGEFWSKMEMDFDLYNQ